MFPPKLGQVQKNWISANLPQTLALACPNLQKFCAKVLTKFARKSLPNLLKITQTLPKNRQTFAQILHKLV